MNPSTDYIFDLDTVSIHSRTELSYELQNSFFEPFKEDEELIIGGNINVDVTVDHYSDDEFLLSFTLDGDLIVPCDRCLGEVEVPVYSEDTLKVVLSKEIRIGDDIINLSEENSDFDICLDEGETKIDLSWAMYEMLVLSLPIQHIHPEGECDPEMENLLQEHLAVLPGGNDEAAEDSQDEEEIDPRWNELKKILNNN